MASSSLVLLSVFDKRGCAELAAQLHRANAQLLSTGGTAKALQDAGLPVTQVGGSATHNALCFVKNRQHL